MDAAARPRWARYLPGLHDLTHYDRGWLRGDVLAGVTVAAYLVPQVMAYAEIARLPAVVGLWASCATLLVYAFVGSSRQLSVGPESTTAIMTAAGVGALVGAVGVDRWGEVAALLALVVAAVCAVAWVARLGFLANLLSRPVLIGYLLGVAVLMIASQLGKVTRLDVAGADPWSQVVSAASQWEAIHAPTAVMALVVFIALVLLRRWAPLWPGPLIALLIAAAVTALVGPERWGLSVIGAVPEGLPRPSVPSAVGVDVWAMVPYAVGIAIVGYSDNVLTARAFAAKRREEVDAAQELLALGAVNLAAGLLQGFPSSSSSSRTVLGDAMGVRTQAHSLVALAVVVATLLFAGPVLAAFPVAALGALVMYAATRLVEIAEIRRIGRFRRSELVLTLLTAVAVVVFGVLAGIGLAVALSILDLVRRIAHPHDGVLGYVPGLAGMHDVDDYPQAHQVPGLVVYRYDSPLFFANSNDFLSRAMASVDRAQGPAEWFLLNAEGNVEVDLTAVDTLAELRHRLDDRGVVFAMARVKQDMRDQLDAAGFVDAVGDHRIYATLPTAVAAYADWYAERHGRRPEGLPA